MQSKLYFFLITVIHSLVFLPGAKSQDCVRTGLNNTVVTSTCSQTCRDLTFQIPDLRSTSDYTFVSTPYNPFPYVTAGGTTDNRLYDDDTYSNIFNLPFPFCFYDNVYTQAIISSNGLVTFDPAYALCAPTQAAYEVINPIPNILGGGNCSFDHYPRASIMGIFMDLDPRSAANGVASSPLNRKIEWRAEGTAPCRRFVVSFYRIGVFENTNCGRTTPATFQIIMYESTGLIDVMIENNVCAPFTLGSNRAILGVQDPTRTKARWATNKNATLWSSSNEGFRFVPSGGASRFVSSELLTMALAPVSLATSSSTTPGLLDITFPLVCSPAASTQYIIRTTYSACENPASLIVGYDTITVNRTPMAAATASTATTCTGASDGTITVTPIGTGPYIYTLDSGTPVVGGSPYTFTNLAAGPHTIDVIDAMGCACGTLNVDVPAGPSLSTTATTSAVLCNGGSTGSITITTPVMGTGPYQYSLDNVIWQASNTFNGLVANTYTVYYQSANGCSGSTPNVVVSAPASVSASNATVPVTCNGLSDGTITITVNGGVPPYQYSINGGGTWQASNVFTVAANTYNNILIRDANNCTVTQSATVTQPIALTASALTTNATCNGGNDGTITVTANGGNAGYQYSLDGVIFQPSNVFNVTGGPPYTVTIRDSKGCITTTPATVGLTNNLTFTPQTDPTICEGTSTQLQLVSNAIQYAWTPSTGLSNASVADPVANPTVTTTYTVTATLGLCSATDVVVVNVNAAPVPNAGPDGFICYGQTYTLQGSGGSQYTWTPSTYLDNPAIAGPTSAATKTITYTLSEVTDAIGCKSLVTDDVVVDVTPPIKVRTFPFDTVAYAGDQFQVNATSIANLYTWTPAFGLSNPNIKDPVVTVGPIGSDVVYQVTAYTIAGCKGEGYVRVKVYKGPDIYVPTGFTPNNDGNNDKFIPFPVGISSIKYFRVFNRWGQLVFSTNTLNDGWDGKLGGVEQPVGVYVWMAEGITRDNKVITKKGTIALIR